MSATVTTIELAGFGVCAMGVAYLTDSVPPEAQGWTVLGLLAVVVVGIGGALIKKVEASGEKTAAAIEKSGDKTSAAMDRCTEAMNKTATNLALLAQDSEASRKESEASRTQHAVSTQQILAGIQSLQAKVHS